MQQRSTRDDLAVGFVREAVADLAHDLRTAPARAVEVLADVVLLAGALVLLSSVGEDSGMSYDVNERTTLAAVGVGLLAAAVLLSALALVLDAGARRHGPGRRALRGRRRVCLALAAGTLLALAGVASLVGG